MRRLQGTLPNVFTLNCRVGEFKVYLVAGRVAVEIQRGMSRRSGLERAIPTQI